MRFARTRLLIVHIPAQTLKRKDALLESARWFSLFAWYVLLRYLVVSPSVWRIACASSVISMPTGHQVMQRPQPTQPVEPNCSYHVDSLCVIHCRYRPRVDLRTLPPWM